MSLSTNVSEKANLIWAIADKLTGVYKPHEYGEVILPLTVIRRFDSILEDTKEAVLAKYEQVKDLPMRDILLRKASGRAFYNTSKYTFKKLLADPENIEANFRDYLNGFSENVQDIIEKFKFDGHITTMANKGILFIVLQEFTTDKANLHPNVISNLEMGYIFEEIIRKFSEAHNEDAGQHYTPREVIRLMVNILFNDDNDILSGSNVAKTIYDPACGTGGMLSVSEEYLHELNADAKLMAFGQELNDQTFAICKADMLIKGNDANFIKDGNTLSNDQFVGQTFDYIISNPPFGREWKNEKADIEKEAKKGFDGRFGAGLPATSDGQMLFLLTAIAKMKPAENGGSRIAIIHNGSPLFSGDAGSGPSDIRKYILENDLLEAIIALPNDIFYNTGIATYIWVLSNKKAGTKREGKVQLINASTLFEKRRKPLGNKRNDIPEEAISRITQIYGDFTENEISKIFDTADFGYTKIVVERPLREKVVLTEENFKKLFNMYKDSLYIDLSRDAIEKMSVADIINALEGIEPLGLFAEKEDVKIFFEILADFVRDEPYMDINKFAKDFNAHELAKEYKMKFNKYRNLMDLIVEKDPQAEIVYKKDEKIADPALRDTENVPLKENIAAYFEREVLPFAEDAWIDENKSKVGYEIPFTRYFYKYEAPRASAEIMAEIMELETDLSGSLEEVFDL